MQIRLSKFNIENSGSRTYVMADEDEVRMKLRAIDDERRGPIEEGEDPCDARIRELETAMSNMIKAMKATLG